MSLSVCLSLSLSSLIVISYILPSQCQYRYLYFALILSSEQQRRSTGGKAGVNCSQLRGKDVKQEGESWQASFQSPSEETPCLCLLGASVLLSFPFCRCLSLLSVYRENGGSGQVPSWEWPELLNSQERVDRPPWVSWLCMFLEWSQRMAIERLLSNFKSVRVMGLMLYSTQTAFPRH